MGWFLIDPQTGMRFEERRHSVWPVSSHGLSFNQRLSTPVPAFYRRHAALQSAEVQG